MGGGGGGGRLLAWGFFGGAGPGAAEPVEVAAPPGGGWAQPCAGGSGFALAIAGSGQLLAWGLANDHGQLGRLHSPTQERPPVPVELGCATAVVSAAAAPAHCFAVTESGDVFAWGWSGPFLGCEDGDNNEPGGAKSNSAGHPSRGHTVRHVSFPWALRLTTIAAGERHALAVTDGGDLFGWGTNAQGQLGLGPDAATFRDPQLISCQLGVRHAARLSAVACGSRHSVALTDFHLTATTVCLRSAEEGEVVTFGWGLYGQVKGRRSACSYRHLSRLMRNHVGAHGCGHGTLEDEPRPRQVTALGGVRVTAVAAGLWHTTCCTEAGEAYAWGGNQFGQLGTGGDLAEVLPKEVRHRPPAGDDGVRSIHCGARHTAALTDTRRVYCWGWNKYGQLGTGSTNDCDRPTEVFMPLRSGETVQAIAILDLESAPLVRGLS
eukprot:SM000009S23468  [mRNA]  locus=s9:97654:100453:- [translate_table: standard]